MVGLFNLTARKHNSPRSGARLSRKSIKIDWNGGMPGGTYTSEPADSLSSMTSASPYFCK